MDSLPRRRSRAEGPDSMAVIRGGVAPRRASSPSLRKRRRYARSSRTGVSVFYQRPAAVGGAGYRAGRLLPRSAAGGGLRVPSARRVVTSETSSRSRGGPSRNGSSERPCPPHRGEILRYASGTLAALRSVHGTFLRTLSLHGAECILGIAIGMVESPLVSYH